MNKDEKLVKLLEDEKVIADGAQNAVGTTTDSLIEDSEVVAPFLNGGCAVTGC